MLLLYAVAIGLLAGVLTRGDLHALASTRVRLWTVALAGLAFQAFLFSEPLSTSVGRLGPSLYVFSTTVVLMALVVNLRQPGFWLIIVGALANFTAIVTNGGLMPASPDAFTALTGHPVVPATDFSNSVIAGPGTAFYFLGDIFVLPPPLPLANVFSIGDVLIGVGGAWFIVAAMHGRAQRATQISVDDRPAPSAGAAARSAGAAQAGNA